MSKNTKVITVVMARHKNGDYNIWLNTNIDYVTLIDGSWCAYTKPAFYTTKMVEEYLDVRFPNMDISISPGAKVEIEVVKVVETSVKLKGDVCCV